MNVDDLQRGAALSVETPGALHTLTHGGVEVGVGEDDGWIFGLQPQHLTHTVGLGMLGNQRIAALAVADEREDVDVSGSHDRGSQCSATAKHHVDHAGRKTLRKRLQQRHHEQHPVFRRFEDACVPHQNRGKQYAKRLVQGVVEWPEAKDHTEGASADLGQGAVHHVDVRSFPLQVFVLGDGVPQVVHRAVEFLLRVASLLPDFPHQQVHHFVAPREDAFDEGFHRRNAFSGGCGRPSAAAVVVGLFRRIQRGHAHLAVEVGHGAQQGPVSFRIQERTPDFAGRPLPGLQLPMEKVLVSVDELRRCLNGWLLRHC